MRTHIEHFAMGDQKTLQLKFESYLAVIENNSPAYLYIAIGRTDFPTIANADITLQPWSKVAQPFTGSTMFSINVETAVNPFAGTVTPNVTITWYDQLVPVAFSTLTPVAQPASPTLNHPLLDGSVDLDTAAHAPVAGDLIYATAGPLWNGLAAGALGSLLNMGASLPAWLAAGNTGDTLRVIGGVPTWDGIAGARITRVTGTQSIANGAGPTAVTFDTEVDDVGGPLWVVGDPTKLTTPKAGVYLVGGSVSFSPSITGPLFGSVSIREGGSNYIARQMFSFLSAPNISFGSVTTRIAFTAGQYIQLIVQQYSGGALNYDKNVGSPILWMEYLHP